ncbi:hypothetical protein Pelo_14413 [Pelomyxa schiedti]|nr:hypothetical protein Pelo_14413 [Pelomyxa schiedti]
MNTDRVTGSTYARDQAAALATAGQARCGAGSPARGLALAPSLVCDLARAWVLPLHRHASFTLTFQETRPAPDGNKRDPCRPSRGSSGTDDECDPTCRNVHVFLGMSLTDGVVDCGVFTIKGKSLPKRAPLLLGCIHWPDADTSSRLRNQQRGRRGARAIPRAPRYRPRPNCLFAALVDSRLAVVDSYGSVVMRDLSGVCEAWSITRVNTRWVVSSTERSGSIDIWRVEQEDGSLCGPVTIYPGGGRDGSQYISAAVLSCKVDDVLVVVKSDTAVYVDLSASFREKSFVVLKEITGIPDNCFDCLWCGDTLCTLHHRKRRDNPDDDEEVMCNSVCTLHYKRKRDNPGDKEFLLYNTKTQAKHIFPLGCIVYPITGVDALCLQLPLSVRKIHSYHTSDLGTYCCSLPYSSAVNPQCFRAGVVPVTEESSREHDVCVVKLHDALTGLVLATLSCQYARQQLLAFATGSHPRCGAPSPARPLWLTDPGLASHIRDACCVGPCGCAGGGEVGFVVCGRPGRVSPTALLLTFGISPVLLGLTRGPLAEPGSPVVGDKVRPVGAGGRRAVVATGMGEWALREAREGLGLTWGASGENTQLGMVMRRDFLSWPAWEYAIGNNERWMVWASGSEIAVCDLMCADPYGSSVKVKYGVDSVGHMWLQHLIFSKCIVDEVVLFLSAEGPAILVFIIVDLLKTSATKTLVLKSTTTAPQKSLPHSDLSKFIAEGANLHMKKSDGTDVLILFLISKGVFHIELPSGNATILHQGEKCVPSQLGVTLFCLHVLNKQKLEVWDCNNITAPLRLIEVPHATARVIGASGFLLTTMGNTLQVSEASSGFVVLSLVLNVPQFLISQRVSIVSQN